MNSLPSTEQLSPQPCERAERHEQPQSVRDSINATKDFFTCIDFPQNQQQHETNNTHTNMPDISQMAESKFLKRADVGAGKLLTIESVSQTNVAKQGDTPEMKWCVSFLEVDKPMVLNRVNSELIAMITKERNSDNWGGFKIVLYDDPTISYAGKLVGGIRVRAPRGAAAQKPPPAKPPQAQLPDDEDDSSQIPF